MKIESPQSILLVVSWELHICIGMENVWNQFITYKTEKALECTVMENVWGQFIIYKQGKALEHVLKSHEQLL